MNAIPLISRFKAQATGGFTSVYWEGILVAEVHKSHFPERSQELDGYYITFKKPLISAMNGQVDYRQSGFTHEDEAVEFLRHTCVTAFTAVELKPTDDERPICRIRDEHINVN